VKPASRLASSISVLVVGAAVATIGAATAWYRTIRPGGTITSGIGNVRLPDVVVSRSPSDLGSPVLPIAVLCLVLGLLAFLVGPRARAVLIGLAVAGGIAMLALSFTVTRPVATGATVHTAAGRIVTPIGAVVVLGAAGAALPVSTSVRRVRMPESGPGE
jgi:hypothetical protein